MRDKITEAVIEDLKLRSERGIKKYNTTLSENNKDDFMNHLYLPQAQLQLILIVYLTEFLF